MPIALETNPGIDSRADSNVGVFPICRFDDLTTEPIGDASATCMSFSRSLLVNRS